MGYGSHSRAEGMRAARARRRRRCWGQAFTGLVLGVLLGLFFRLQSKRDRDVDCSETLLPTTAGLTRARIRYNEDPLATIGLSEEETALVFVGVMTAMKYLDSRAVAVYDTWGRALPGRVAFFSSEASQRPAARPDLPLIRLRGVDDSYPPQKKSFKMLQYMWDNYGDRFEWFVRADDDVYIRHDKLETFLRSLDSSRPLFIGQAGRGNQEEFGLLSLEYDENFCMGGPGIIMSRETLKRVAPHVKHCLRNLYTTHEDVEIGRCIRKFANVSCTWSYEMQTILYHNSSGRDAFTGNLKQKEVHRAITMHPVKQPEYLYRIHNYVRSLQIQDLQHQRVLLQREMLKMRQKGVTGGAEEENEGKTAQLLGLPPNLTKYRRASERDIIPWDFIQRSLFSTSNMNPRRRIESPYKDGMEDVIREIMEMINQFSRQRGRVIEFQDLLYGYYRVDPIHGTDYILDLLLKYKKYRGRKMTVPVRRHAYLQQQFTGYEIREVGGVEDETEGGKGSVQNVITNSLQLFRQQLPLLASGAPLPTHDKIINFILPLAGRFETFQRFMRNYEQVCLTPGENAVLIIVLFRSPDPTSANKIMEHVAHVQKRHPGTRVKVIPVADEFARALALQIGTAYVPDDPDNILFYIDVDMVFSSATLYRIRMNTIRGKQVYFPVVFSELDPSVVYGTDGESLDHFRITRDTGYWRQFGFGIASLYRSDVEAVGGFNTAIRGWGKEDVDLFDKLVTSNLTVFRAADPTLVHVFHVVECAPDLEPSQLRMCKGTRADTYGSVNTLANILYANPRAIFQFAKNRSKIN